MYDVNGVSASAGSQYFIRSRGEVDASRAASRQASPQILGRSKPTDQVTFSQRLAQAGAAIGAGAAPAAKPASLLDQIVKAVIGDTPSAAIDGPQDLESNSMTFNQQDLDAIIENFGAKVEESSEFAAYDFDGDGTIGSADLNVVLANFVAST